jgi:hypothetical protein
MKLNRLLSSLQRKQVLTLVFGQGLKLFRKSLLARKALGRGPKSSAWSAIWFTSRRANQCGDPRA